MTNIEIINKITNAVNNVIPTSTNEFKVDPYSDTDIIHVSVLIDSKPVAFTIVRHFCVDCNCFDLEKYIKQELDKRTTKKDKPMGNTPEYQVMVRSQIISVLDRILPGRVSELAVDATDTDTIRVHFVDSRLDMGISFPVPDSMIGNEAELYKGIVALVGSHVIDAGIEEDYNDKIKVAIGKELLDMYNGSDYCVINQSIHFTNTEVLVKFMLAPHHTSELCYTRDIRSNNHYSLRLDKQEVIDILDDENNKVRHLLYKAMDKVDGIEEEVVPTMQNKAVDHPSHYGGADNPYEAIKVIEAWELGFCLGNTIKYIARAGKKHSDCSKQDLQKALWYLERAIGNMEDDEAEDEK